ncbi:MAG TPA: hypothetical protein PK668_16925 [Myxococcota bacterium]|nr:hypothetical protein [Myxococcota bacterium]HRY94843.1 hypothetical protein [Myxococcota bacterium]
MAKNPMTKKEDRLYLIVERLREDPKDGSNPKKMYNFSDPTALRALRIHRHLKALEQDILEAQDTDTISIEPAVDPGHVVLQIRNNEIHCSRVAYLSQRELRLLRRNRKVANALRRALAARDVA